MQRGAAEEDARMKMLISADMVSDIQVGSVVEFEMRCPVKVTEITDAYAGEPDPHPDLFAAFGKALAIWGEYMDGSGCRTLRIHRECSRIAGPHCIEE
jgi:hypothetical protein